MQKTNGSLIFEFPSDCNLNNTLFKMLAAAWNMISGGGQYLASVSELAKTIECLFFLQAFLKQIPPATITIHLTTQVTNRLPVH